MAACSVYTIPNFGDICPYQLIGLSNRCSDVAISSRLLTLQTHSDDSMSFVLASLREILQTPAKRKAFDQYHSKQYIKYCDFRGDWRVMYYLSFCITLSIL